MILFSILILLTILINILVLFLVRQKESRECECANVYGWKRKYIKYYSVIALAVILFIYIIPFWIRLFKFNNIGNKLTSFIMSNPFQLLLSVFIAFGFFNVFFIFKYTKELDGVKCDCENKYESSIRKVINYYSIAVITIYIITTLLSFSINLK